MRITVMEDCGFCYGVQRAVDKVESLLAAGKKVCTLGPLLHNPDFLAELEERGVITVQSADEVPPDYTVVLRSHGVTPEVCRRLQEKGISICDATCPSVGKIHRLVSEFDAEQDFLLLAGDPKHPEIEAILGHAHCPFAVFSSAEQLEALLEAQPDICGKSVKMASQTTFSVSEWKKCEKIVRRYCTNAGVFDTICSTTENRQKKAEALATECDAMIVIGGRGSSNTAKLFQVCSRLTDSFWIESAEELPLDKLHDKCHVGVTAGASTPSKIIQEVLRRMDEKKVDVEIEEFNFEEALEESFKRLNKEERVKGIVTAIRPNEVSVDVGRKQAGYIPLSELTNDPNAKPSDIVKIGDELILMIMKTNDQEGTIMLSKRRVDAMKNWDNIVKASENDTILDGTVVEVIRGGVLVNCDGVRVFVPASQSGVPRGGNLEDLLRKAVQLKIIEVEQRRKRAVGSIRAGSRVAAKEAESKFWDVAKVGDTFTGPVKSLTSFGAFVDLGGVDGMVHRTELSWQRIRHPKDVVDVGDVITVYIKELDTEKKRISLGYKKESDNPWNKMASEFSVGQVVSVKITGLMTYGAFAELIPGVEGLIHVSQIANKHVTKPSDILSVGQVVDAKITEIDFEKQKVSLSIKATLPEESAETATDVPAEAEDVVSDTVKEAAFEAVQNPAQ